MFMNYIFYHVHVCYPVSLVAKTVSLFDADTLQLLFFGETSRKQFLQKILFETKKF